MQIKEQFNVKKVKVKNNLKIALGIFCCLAEYCYLMVGLLDIALLLLYCKIGHAELAKQCNTVFLVILVGNSNQLQ